MPRSVLTTGILLWFLATGIDAQSLTRRLKVAEGRFGFVDTEGAASNEPKRADLNEWTLWREANGALQFEARLIPPPDSGDLEVRSILRFNQDFRLIEYEWRMRWPSEGKQAELFCGFEADEIRCAESGRDEDGPSRFSGRAPVHQPYVLVPELPMAADLPWFLTAQVHFATRKLEHETRIVGYEMDDGPRYGTIAFNPTKTIIVKYLGRDTTKVAGREVLAHKYSLRTERREGSGNGSSMVWTSERGLVLVYAAPEGPRWELTEFTEFIPFAFEKF